MSFARLLLAALVATVEANLSFNQCPQPTETNPDPPDYIFGDQDNCHYYYTCSKGEQIRMKCKPYDKTRYSDFYHTCVEVNSAFDTCTRLNAQRECSRGLSGLVGHPTLCHRYYNCSQKPEERYASLGKYENECPYMQLFDLRTRSCTPPRDAVCGPHRVTPKDPCDYAKIHCIDSYCQPCSSKSPSCDQLEDGFHPYPGREWTQSYISCKKHKLEKKLLCRRHEQTGTDAFFSPVKKQCVSRWEVPRSISYGLEPSCKGKLFGVYRVAERRDIYYSCPAVDVFYCEPGTSFSEIKYLCETTSA